MDLYTYRQFLLDTIPSAKADCVTEMLAPLGFDKTISPYLDVARVRRAKHLLLAALDNLVIDKSSMEAFSISGAVKAMSGHIGKTLLTTVTTAATLTLISDKEKLKGIIIELKRLKNPKLMIGTKLPLSKGDKFPLTKPELTFKDVKELVDKHIVMLKATNAFINSAKFHVTTIPDVNYSNWLNGLRSMGGSSDNNNIVSPVMFGNVRITTSIVGSKVTSKTDRLTPAHSPTHYVNPGPLGLASHVVAAEKAIETVWNIDSTLANTVTEVYNAIDRKRGSTSVKNAFRSIVHVYYSTVLSATMTLTQVYSDMCIHAAQSVISEDATS